MSNKHIFYYWTQPVLMQMALRTPRHPSLSYACGISVTVSIRKVTRNESLPYIFLFIFFVQVYLNIFDFTWSTTSVVNTPIGVFTAVLNVEKEPLLYLPRGEEHGYRSPMMIIGVLVMPQLVMTASFMEGRCCSTGSVLRYEKQYT